MAKNNLLDDDEKWSKEIVEAVETILNGDTSEAVTTNVATNDDEK